MVLDATVYSKLIKLIHREQFIALLVLVPVPIFIVFALTTPPLRNIFGAFWSVIFVFAGMIVLFGSAWLLISAISKRTARQANSLLGDILSPALSNEVINDLWVMVTRRKSGIFWDYTNKRAISFATINKTLQITVEEIEVTKVNSLVVR